MSKGPKIAIVVLLAIVVVAVVSLKAGRHNDTSETPENVIGVECTTGLPTLIDLGATTCTPCRMMAPILDELKAEKKGKLEVVFINVRENPAAGDMYGVKTIPTQIFFDSKGNELYRHEGFMPKEDILATFKKHGIDL